MHATHPHRRRFLLALTLIAGLTVGCRQGAATSHGADTIAEPTAEWRLSNSPELTIGTVEGDESYQLHDAVSSVRLGNGRIVILNAGSSQLRFYDSAGSFEKAVGTKGMGPGEFRNPERIYLTHPDSLLVYDGALQRESRYGTDGAWVWSEPREPAEGDGFGRDAWLHGRNFVDGPMLPSLREPVRLLLDRLPPPATGQFRFVKIDPQWRAWVRLEPHPPGTPADWHVYSVAGEPLATVRTPPGFELHHAGPDFVLGRGYDSLSVEYIQLYRLAGAPARADVVDAMIAAGAVRTPTTTEAPPEELLTRMRSVMRDMMARQEIYYATSKDFRYASSVVLLGLPEEELQGLVVHVVNAGPRGWTALAFDPNLPFACGVRMGGTGPIGWSPGKILCS